MWLVEAIWQKYHKSEDEIADFHALFKSRIEILPPVWLN